MISTGKRARRQHGTRAACKKAMGRKGKRFATPSVRIRDYPTGEKARILCHNILAAEGGIQTIAGKRYVRISGTNIFVSPEGKQVRIKP